MINSHLHSCFASCKSWRTYFMYFYFSVSFLYNYTSQDTLWKMFVCLINMKRDNGIYQIQNCIQNSHHVPLSFPAQFRLELKHLDLLPLSISHLFFNQSCSIHNLYYCLWSLINYMLLRLSSVFFKPSEQSSD